MCFFVILFFLTPSLPFGGVLCFSHKIPRTTKEMLEVDQNRLSADRCICTYEVLSRAGWSNRDTHPLVKRIM